MGGIQIHQFFVWIEYVRLTDPGGPEKFPNYQKQKYIRSLCTEKKSLTLFPMAYLLPLCYGGGWNPPPQLKTHLGVLDSKFFNIFL